MIISAHAYARAGLVGNPSDGYFGKTISFIIRDYRARVRLWESPHFEILPGDGDLCRFDSVQDFRRHSKLFGYYGALRLMKATVVRFMAYANEKGFDLHDRNFTLQFDSDIPRLVGMSGSSAIVVATLRAMMQYYNVTIDKAYMPMLTLNIERQELDITAGLQDRVIQTYEGMVYMDFKRELVEKTGAGIYEELKPKQMPPVYVAFDADRAEVSGVPHRNLRQLWESGEKQVVDAMFQFADFAAQSRTAILNADWPKLHKLTNANYNLRKTIMPIAPENDRMVQTARSVGASGKFAGSGGTIVGVYQDEAQYKRLVEALSAINCTVFKPTIFG